MGFHLEINSILRYDGVTDLAVGQVYDFEKSGSRLFFDDLPIWLTRSDWTALAEIDIVTQTRTPKSIRGQFRVRYLYSGAEQETLTGVFRRLYSTPGDFDPHLYVLLGDDEYQAASRLGYLVRDDLRKEGFIHASPAGQLTRVANKYYRDARGLRCLVVATKRITSPVKWEPATGGLYPHIYGPLNMDAVDWVVELPPSADGAYHITADSLRAPGPAAPSEPSTKSIGGPVCSEIVGPDLLPAEAAPLSEDQVDALWQLFQEIGRAWDDVILDSANLKSSWLELVETKSTTNPSYAGEYDNAIRVVQELVAAHGDEAFKKLFFEYKLPPNPSDMVTRLAHAKRFVVDEFIRMHVLAGGFKAYGARNYSGYLGGSRYNLRPTVRAYKEPKKEGVS